MRGKTLFFIYFIFAAVISFNSCSKKNEIWITNPPVVVRSADEQKIAWVQQVKDRHEVWDKDTESRIRAVAVNGVITGNAYAAISTIVLSPDGMSTAWTAMKQDKWIMVLNGREIGPLCEDISTNWIVFSPDSKHLAWAARIDGRLHMFVDGEKISGEGYGKVGFPVFSDDGSRFVYVAGNNGNVVLVERGNISAEWETIRDPVFSPDGKHLAWTAEKDGRASVIIDGSVEKSADAAGKILFSPDSSHYAYSITENGKSYVLKDGRISGGKYAMDTPVNSLVFGQNDGRLAFAAYTGSSWKVVIDGKEGPDFRDVLGDSIHLSPDGKGYAYIAANGGGWFVMKNGIPGQGWDNIVFGKSPYSKDGSRFFYASKLNQKWRLVENGTVGPVLDFDEIRQQAGPVFSEDSRYISYTARKGEKWQVVVNGIAGPPFDRIYAGVFGPQGIAYLAENKKTGWLYACTQPYPDFAAESEETQFNQSKLSRLPEIPLTEEECAPCKVERQSMTADELLELE